MSSSVSAMIIAAAQSAGVDPALALEVANQESSLRANPPNGAAGEIGVFQILPSTAPGVNLYDLQANIQTGVSLLAHLLSLFGDATAAVAAYNCGASCVQTAMTHYGSAWFAHVPGSTQSYASSIMGNYQTAYSVSPTIPSPIGVTPLTAGFVPDLSTLRTPGTGMPIWTQIALALGAILIVGFLISES